MDYSKFPFRYYLLVIVIFILIQEHSCLPRKPKISCPTLKLPNGFVRLRSNGRVSLFKCRPGFKAVGPKATTCVRGQWEGELPVCVRNGCMKVSPPKNGDMVVTYAGALVMFVCNNGYNLNGSQHIYCNGQIWNGTVPTCQVDNAAPERSCDFESEDLCGWTQDSQHEFDWRRQNYATPSGHVSTGPSNDHTKGPGLDGYYMYIESSSPRMVNDKARLFSPVYPAEMSLDACFIFWYHMFGATTGSLNVYMKSENMDWSSVAPVFSKSGDQGNTWFRKTVRFPNTTYPFQVIVEGVRGTSYVSDTAFDDVMLANGTDCLEPTTDASQTDSAKVETGGGGEVFDDAQSCRWRCTGNTDSTMDQSGRDISSPPETPVMVLCDCHLGCGERKTCCPDYSSYCILAKVTSAPVVPTMGYRTIASVHYFSLNPRPPPPPTRLPQPPPLPPLPPKPTMTSPELPNLSLPPLTISIPPLVTEKTQLASKMPDVTVTPTNPAFDPSPFISTTISDKNPTLDEVNSTVVSFSNSPIIYTSTSNSVENPAQKENFTYSDMVEMPTVTSEFPYIKNFSLIVDVAYQTRDPMPERTTKIPSKLSTKPTEIVPKNFTVKDNTLKYDSRTTGIPIVLTIKNTTKVNNVNDVVKPKTKFTTPKTVPSKSSKAPITTTVKPVKPSITKKQYPIVPTVRPVKPFTTKRQYPVTKIPRVQQPTTKKSTGNRMNDSYQKKDSKSNDAETSFILKKDLIGIPKRKSGSISQQQSQQSKKDSTLASVPMIVGISAGLVLIALAVGITMFGVVWRRRASSHRNNLNDDSDVRFLTSDEVLDFNIARPTEQEEFC